MNKPRNYASFYVLLRKLPHASREVLISTHTAGRTESLREMTCREYEDMIRSMRRLIGSEEALRKARSSALHCLQRYGIDTTNWDEVNRFVSQKRIAGREFALLDEEALKALTRKMRAIITKTQRELALKRKATRLHYEALQNYRQPSC